MYYKMSHILKLYLLLFFLLTISTYQAFCIDNFWYESKIIFWNYLESSHEPHSLGGSLLSSEDESSISPILSLGVLKNFDNLFSFKLWGSFQRIAINHSSRVEEIVKDLLYKDSSSSALIQNRYRIGSIFSLHLLSLLQVGITTKIDNVKTEWKERDQKHFFMSQFNPWISYKWDQNHKTHLYFIFLLFDDKLDPFESYQSFLLDPLKLSLGIRHNWFQPWDEAILSFELNHNEYTSNDIWFDHTRQGFSIKLFQTIYRKLHLKIALNRHLKRYILPIRSVAGCSQKTTTWGHYDRPELCMRRDVGNSYEVGFKWDISPQWQISSDFQVEEMRNHELLEFNELKRWLVFSLSWLQGKRYTDQETIGGPYERFKKELW